MKFDSMLLALFEKVEESERSFRERRIRAWRLYDNYWHGIQFDYFDSLNADTDKSSENIEGLSEYLASRTLNVYRAHGESIISALSSSFPTVAFYPEDADKPEDVSSALTKSKLARMILQQNNPELFLARLFYIMYNQDFVACLLSTESDPKLGTIITGRKEPYKECPECSKETENGYCPHCEKMQEKYIETTEPRKFQKLSLFGPRNVCVPAQSNDIETVPYLILRELKSTAFLKWKFDGVEIKDYDSSIENNRALLSYKEMSENAEESAIIITFWVKPWALNALDDSHEEVATKFMKKYPNGAKVTMTNKKILKIQPEDLATVWTVSKSPLNETFYDDPMGKVLIDNQDLMNETFNLIIKTISRGVTETYADPEVVNVEAINERISEPGSVVEAKAKSGTRLSDSFYQNQPAALSENVIAFLDRLQQQAQFLSGSFPSIYGGQIKGSRTIGEYDRSTERALERLSIRYRIANNFILEVVRKAVDRYTENMQEREVFVSKIGDNFVSDSIYKSNIGTNPGRVEIEGGGHVPLSWAQIKASLFELMNSNNQMLAQIMTHPQNSTMVKEVIGIPELYVPGEDSRNKQWFEISQMITQDPIDENTSSVPVDETDNHMVEFEICKVWLASDKGLYYKTNKPNQYLNVQLHARAHSEVLAQQQQPPQEAPNAAPPNPV